MELNMLNFDYHDFKEKVGGSYECNKKSSTQFYENNIQSAIFSIYDWVCDSMSDFWQYAWQTSKYIKYIPPQVQGLKTLHGIAEKISEEMFQKKAAYGVLGLSDDASEQEIRKVYRKLSVAHHPDKNQKHESASKFQAISSAYKILTSKNAAIEEEVKKYRASCNITDNDQWEQGLKKYCKNYKHELFCKGEIQSEFLSYLQGAEPGDKVEVTEILDEDKKLFDEDGDYHGGFD